MLNFILVRSKGPKHRVMQKIGNEERRLSFSAMTPSLFHKVLRLHDFNSQSDSLGFGKVC